MIKTEKDIKQEIKEALRWEPILRESDITVHIEDGTVVLEGTVNTSVKKIAAEEVARRVARLQSIVNEIEVIRKDLKSDRHKNHEDKLLVNDVKEAIRRNTDINKKWIKVKVKDGWVTLEGTVPHAEQQDKLRQIAADVPGVQGVANLIKVAHHEEREEVSEETENRKEEQTTEITTEKENEMKRKSDNKPEEMTRNEERAEREGRRDRMKRRQERIERRVARKREEREDFRKDFRKEKHDEERRDRKQRFSGLRRTARTAGKLLRVVRNFYRKIRE